MLVRAARSVARKFTVTRGQNSWDTEFWFKILVVLGETNDMPGSYLNGAEGRTIPKTNNIGPQSAEEAYNSHEYYNHDKVFFILFYWNIYTFF